MAITPNEAGRIREEEREKLRALEREVDACLSRNYQGRGRVNCSSIVGKVTGRVRDELLRRYRAAGWEIKQESCNDPREPGTFWYFSAAPVPASAWQGDQGAPPPWRD